VARYALWSGGAALLTLALLEVALRTYYGLTARAHVVAALHSSAAVTNGTEAELRGGVVPSPIPDLVYEPRPRWRGILDGVPVATNRLGARHDYDFPVDKGRDGFRVIGIGDEGMWGRGVANDETYLDRLQEKLGARAPGRVEVINLAVWGYNAFQQVAALRWKGMLFSPDLVIAGLSGDDVEPPRLPPGRPYRPRAGLYLLDAFVALAGREPAGGEGALATLMAAHDELATLAREGRFGVVVFSECLLPVRWEALPEHCKVLSAADWRAWKHRNHTHWGFLPCGYAATLVPKSGEPWGAPTREGNLILADLLYDCLIRRPSTQPAFTPIQTIRLTVAQPAVALSGCAEVDVQADDPRATCGPETGLRLRWLPRGERFVVSLTLPAPAPGAAVRIGPDDGELREARIDPDRVLRPIEPFEVDQEGDLLLRLETDAHAGATPLALSSVELVRVAPRGATPR
jgi:hypothetical protein